MIECLISGKIIGAAETRTSKAGRQFVTARLRVSAGAEETHFIRVTAFSEDACRALAALGDGDGCACAGTLKAGIWTPAAGEPRVSLDLVASQVLTIYGVKRKRDATHPAATAAPTRRPTRHQGDEEDFGEAGRWPD